MSELTEQVKKLPRERQRKGAPYFRVMEYWEKNCPTFLASLGSDAEHAALLRQNQYLDRFHELIEEGADPLKAHQAADREAIYHPTADVDLDWVNRPPLHPVIPETMLDNENTRTPTRIEWERVLSAFDEALDREVEELNRITDLVRERIAQLGRPLTGLELNEITRQAAKEFARR